jgi:hypothetical protein
MGTFLFSWGVSIYLLTKNLSKRQRQDVIFLMIFSSIQLVDAILWKNKMKNNNINYYLTSYIIPLILSLQVIYSIFFINKDVPSYILIPAILNIVYLFFSYNSSYTIPSKNLFKSPLWGGTKGTPISMLLFSMLIFYGRIGLSGWKLINSGAIVLTLILSFLFSGGFGTLWCAFANIASLYYLFIYG